jgi:Dynein heavy chain AAA lid domain
MIQTLFRICDHHLEDLEARGILLAMEFKDKIALIDKILVFSTIWSLGATVSKDARKSFN